MFKLIMFYIMFKPEYNCHFVCVLINNLLYAFLRKNSISFDTLTYMLWLYVYKLGDMLYNNLNTSTRYNTFTIISNVKTDYKILPDHPSILHRNFTI